jgi:hypothetical protein
MARFHRFNLLLISAAGLSASATLPSAGTPLTGQWGGRHVGLRLNETGGVLDYDCAAGTIDEPVMRRRDGRFEASGTHTPASGGPERVGEVRPTYRAYYTGAVRGQRMTLAARVENGVTLGPFTLVRGADPLIMRCL